MCKYVKELTGVYTIPITQVNWTSPDTSLLLCSEAPPGGNGYVYEHVMNYFYLNPRLEAWLRELGAKFALFWCHITAKWCLELYDDTVALLYKLTWEEN